jgi:hypothetical protein
MGTNSTRRGELLRETRLSFTAAAVKPGCARHWNPLGNKPLAWWHWPPGEHCGIDRCQRLGGASAIDLAMRGVLSGSRTLGAALRAPRRI